MESNYQTIPNVEVFRKGDYGKKGVYESSDLLEMAASYNPSYLEPRVTKDHDLSGPKFGVARNPKTNGESLYMDLDVSPQMYEELLSGSYSDRSVEIAKDDDGKLYVRAVTFLGAASPEVKGMSKMSFPDEASMFYDEGEAQSIFRFSSDLEITDFSEKNNTTIQKDESMSDKKEQEVVDFGEKVKEATAQFAEQIQTLELEKSKLENEVSSFKQNYETLQREFEETKKEIKDKEIASSAEKAFSDLLSHKDGPKIIPAQKESFIKTYSTLMSVSDDAAGEYLASFSSGLSVVDTAEKVPSNIDKVADEYSEFIAEFKEGKDYEDSDKVDSALDKMARKIMKDKGMKTEQYGEALKEARAKMKDHYKKG